MQDSAVYSTPCGKKRVKLEAKKTNFEMAEYDQSFIDRMMGMADDELLMYLHALPELERKAMEQAIFRALSQRAVQDQIDNLTRGLAS